MAGMDYGGAVYLNGKHCNRKGLYRYKTWDHVGGNAVLGNGPYICMDKTIDPYVVHKRQMFKLHELKSDIPEQFIDRKFGWIDLMAAFHEKGLPLVAQLPDGTTVEVIAGNEPAGWIACYHEDMNGNVWAGFSGYGIGDGHEGNGHVYGTSNCAIEHIIRKTWWRKAVRVCYFKD